MELKLRFYTCRKTQRESFLICSLFSLRLSIHGEVSPMTVSRGTNRMPLPKSWIKMFMPAIRLTISSFAILSWRLEIVQKTIWKFEGRVIVISTKKRMKKAGVHGSFIGTNCEALKSYQIHLKISGWWWLMMTLRSPPSLNHWLYFPVWLYC